MSASMQRSGLNRLVIVALVILAFAGAIRARQWFIDRERVDAEVSLRGKTFQIEIANTPTKRERGLGGRDALAADQGMYFPFDQALPWVFWMKDMRFPIDILWLRDSKIVDIHKNVPPPAGDGPLETYRPLEPADAVLELKAGTSDELGLQPGDALIFRAKP